MKALIEMQLLINEVEKLIKEVDISNPYNTRLGRELDNMNIENFVKLRFIKKFLKL